MRIRGSRLSALVSMTGLCWAGCGSDSTPSVVPSDAGTRNDAGSNVIVDAAADAIEDGPTESGSSPPPCSREAITLQQAAGTALEAAGARDRFRVDVGGGAVAAANGSFGGVRREINWDGVPNGSASPNPFAADFFNTSSARGVVFTTSGTGFQVSATAASGVAVRFGNIDASYTTLFEAFSAERLFSPIGSNLTDAVFRVPGTTTAASTRAFGVMFVDVDRTDSAKLEVFGVDDARIAELPAPTSAGAAFSFVGLTFPEACIKRVRITTGSAAIGAGITESASRDLVVLDDMLYGEPVALP
jgi:hypothetical protein